MKIFTVAVALLLIAESAVATAQQDLLVKPSKQAPKMAERGRPITDRSGVASSVPTAALQQDELPLERLSNLAQKGFKDVGTHTRSAKDAQIYRTISPQ